MVSIAQGKAKWPRAIQFRREAAHRHGVLALDQFRQRRPLRSVRTAIRALGAWPFVAVDPSTYKQLRRYRASRAKRSSGQVEAVKKLIRSLRPIDPGIQLLRIGPERDGGYLVPDDLEGIQHVFSPGIGLVSGFEADLAGRGMEVFLADASVDGPAVANPAFRFEKKFVGSFESATTTTLDGWKRRCIGDHAGDLLLQMDIEGAEYEALTSASPEFLSQCRIIVAEFHELDQLWSGPWFQFASRVFERLLMTHAVVHIHPNNGMRALTEHGIEIPSTAEFTFLRKDRLRSSTPQRSFPHPLDRDNWEGGPPMPLPAYWYGAN